MADLIPLAAIVAYAMWVAVTFVMLGAAGFVYIWWTPGNEVRMIREGNVAAATALGGTILGYAVVINAATANNTAILRTVMWSVVALVIQIAVFEIVSRLLFHRADWSERLAQGDLAYGVTLGAFSLAAGVISAGCLQS